MGIFRRINEGRLVRCCSICASFLMEMELIGYEDSF